MSKQLKLLPAFIMLLAGAITSIITYSVGYSPKSALIILLLVLVVFYIIGAVLQKLIAKFEMANEEKAKAQKKEQEDAQEGTVVEKDESEINKGNENEAQGADRGNRPEL